MTTHRDITHWLNEHNCILAMHLLFYFCVLDRIQAMLIDKNTHSSVIRIYTRKVLSNVFLNFIPYFFKISMNFSKVAFGFSSEKCGIG